MDLLKNLMFMQAPPDQFDRLKGTWKTLVDTLYKEREKPLRFLRYFIFATYQVDRLREDEIYDWFVANEAACGYRLDPVGYVRGLLEAAQAYVCFLNGQNASGGTDRYLVNMKFLSGAARQHLILLLAARKLPPEMLSELSRNVENLFFAHIITRENTREFERRFAQWATELSQVQTSQELRDFMETRFGPGKQALAARFRLALRGLDETAIQKYRMRYLLGKLTQYVNEQAYGSGQGEAELAAFINNRVHVEHILPQTPSAAAMAEFDRPDDHKEYVPRLGNLALAEQAINISLGNKPFGDKKSVYPSSKFLLTKAIGERPTVGVNTAVDRAVADLTPFEQWTSAAVADRHEQLTRLAFRVWEMPEAPEAKQDA